MICEKEKCTGCYACYNICPKDAIEMKEDEYGNIYPQIDESKCIKCGLCKKICKSKDNMNFNSIKKAYAVWNKDNDIRRTSTSGGAATTLYNYFIENNGIGYGVNNYEDNKVAFYRICNTEDISRVRGSKYVHAYVENSYREAETDLKDGKKVIFIGTPCQVAGLKAYLRKEYENLYIYM